MTILQGKTVTEKAHHVVLTEAAALKAKSLMEREQRDDYRLRLAVKSGGCSGFRYDLFFDERVLDGDTIVEFQGVEVIVDKKSVPLLGKFNADGSVENAVIDFEDTIASSVFRFDNPGAQNSCACGESFH